jgi:hypothetical protein
VATSSYGNEGRKVFSIFFQIKKKVYVKHALASG